MYVMGSYMIKFNYDIVYAKLEYKSMLVSISDC